MTCVVLHRADCNVEAGGGTGAEGKGRYMSIIIAGSPSASLHVADASEVPRALDELKALAAQGALSASHTDALLGTASAWTAAMASHRGGTLHGRLLEGAQPGIELVALTKAPCPFAHEQDEPAAVIDAWQGPQGSAALLRLGPDETIGAPYGVAQHAFRSGSYCGDRWGLALSASHATAVLVDGLGHGPVAATASATGVDAFIDSASLPATGIAQTIHTAMGGTCGGVGAIAQFDRGSGVLTFVGVGDIAGRLVGGRGPRGLASGRGILGAREPSFRPLPYDAHDALLILHTDGVRERWNLDEYPGLVTRHPALIAALLHRDFCRPTDDGTLLAVDLRRLMPARPVTA